MNEMANMILAIAQQDDELRNALIAGLCALVLNGGDNIPVSAPVSENWYDEFSSDVTEVTVKGTTVQVKVARGHAPEWHDRLRAAGFKWSRKNSCWWAYLDDDKRAQVAAHNRESDALTAGMTREEKRDFWRARKAARVA